MPVEWFALSAGARIAMDSGTENMDWIAKALRRIIDFTQAGGEINVVVAGINVGAQPYWNAEATMLMHCKGVLIMTPDSAMVLTGKQSLDFSGGVSAEDNFGIGGYDRVMGPNGQAQYWAKDLAEAYGILLEHYDHTWVAPGRPRLAAPRRAIPRIVTSRHTPRPEGQRLHHGRRHLQQADQPRPQEGLRHPHLMRSVTDQDHPMLERWAGMADAETSVVTDAHIGGIPVCLLGIESKSVARRGFPPTDGPDSYTAGTLFPKSSKKTARGINAASGNRPLVVLANLSGFDGSPESMRKLQLEYGAEIGRAIVNFEGRIVFVVVSRYHGGAFVVFSKALNDDMTVLAVEGSFASVIGGAPAAAVVFARDVDARTAKDPRVADLEDQVRSAAGSQRRSRRPTRRDEAGGPRRSPRPGRVRIRRRALDPPRRRGRLGRRGHRCPGPATTDHCGARVVTTQRPRVVAVSRDDQHRFSKVPVNMIVLVEGLGVDGDAHSGTTVQHLSRVRRDPTTPNLRQGPPDPRRVARRGPGGGAPDRAGIVGENILTAGIDLLGLPTDTRLHLGEAVLRVTGLRNPCRQINDLSPGLLKICVERADGVATDSDVDLGPTGGTVSGTGSRSDARPGSWPSSSAVARWCRVT